MSRISREEMFTDMVRTVAKRSTCNRAKVGSLLVMGGRVISQGYAGSPSGMPHCIDEGCSIGEHGGCTRTIHAEQNVIAFAAREGIRTRGAHLYCTMSPCLACAKLIINSGIEEVYFLERYRDDSGVKLLIAAGIQVFQYVGDEESVKYGVHYGPVIL